MKRNYVIICHVTFAKEIFIPKLKGDVWRIYFALLPRFSTTRRDTTRLCTTRYRFSNLNEQCPSRYTIVIVDVSAHRYKRSIRTIHVRAASAFTGRASVSKRKKRGKCTHNTHIHTHTHNRMRSSGDAGRKGWLSRSAGWTALGFSHSLSMRA